MHIQNIRDLIAKIIGSESDNNTVQPELEIFTEQEFRVFQIRNTISSYFGNKNVSTINLNKERNPFTLYVASQNQILKLLQEPNLKTSSEIENKVLLTNQTLNTKIKAKSCHPSISFNSSSKFVI